MPLTRLGPSSEPPIRWGIAGLGSIAALVAPEFGLVPDAVLAAVGSRSVAHAEAFAAEHGVPRAHGSYRDLIDDPDVDVVYVTTPHPQHHAIALSAVRAGKAVLLQKDFTSTRGGAREGGDEARRPAGLCFEAMGERV